jgi:GNAT superfamily N-acetyltransferase
MIRPAEPKDAAEIAQLYLASRKRHVAFARLVHSDNDVRLWIRTVLIRGGHVFVAEEGGVLCAMMAISVKDDIGWIDQMYVHPDMIGQGYGTALLNFARTKLPSPIRLYTFQVNYGARRFYERAGFVALARSDGKNNEEKCPDILYEWRKQK